MRLSEPMREALEAAAKHGALRYSFGLWGPTAGGPPWVGQSTINALERRGLMLRDGMLRSTITQEGRVAIFRIFPKGDREAIGMKEGEDRHG